LLLMLVVVFGGGGGGGGCFMGRGCLLIRVQCRPHLAWALGGCWQQGASPSTLTRILLILEDVRC
jgi:hypothetical protein